MFQAYLEYNVSCFDRNIVAQIKVPSNYPIPGNWSTSANLHEEFCARKSNRVNCLISELIPNGAD